MKRASRKNSIIFASVAIFCIAMGIIFGVDTEKQPDNAASTSERRKTKIRKEKPQIRKVQAKRKKQRNIVEANIKAEMRPKQKPNMLVLEDAEEKELTELARKVLASLQAALDSESYDQILKIIEMANTAPKGSLGKTTAGMPVALRKKIVEALSWFGARAIPEMTGFLADENPEVFQMTLDQFEQALSDVSLGDKDRAKIVVLASSVLTDQDALDIIQMEISNMRSSVTADTIYSIAETGTPQAKETLQENLDFFTGGENIQTVEELNKWKADHPDDPDDDILYGPMETDD